MAENFAMSEQLGITPTAAVGVVIATIGMYLCLILLVRLAGQRSLASMSSFDLGCVIALGAVIGRTTLLLKPTFLTGVVALTTLFLMQALLRQLRMSSLIDRLLNRPPVVLMEGEQILSANLRHAKVTEDELRQKLRLAGISRLVQVHCVVLERTGEISVLRRDGEPDLDRWIVADVAQLAEQA